MSRKEAPKEKKYRPIKDIRDWKYFSRREKVFILIVVGGLVASVLFALLNGAEIGKGTTTTTVHPLLTMLGADDPISVKIIVGLCLLWIGIGTVLVTLKKITQQRLITLSLAAIIIIVVIALIVKLVR